MRSLDEAFDPAQRSRPAVWPGCAAGQVQRVDAGGVFVTLEGRAGATVGPCRWEPRRLAATASAAGPGGHVHAVDAGTPPARTPCLVVFPDGDRDQQPWIVAFDGWPA